MEVIEFAAQDETARRNFSTLAQQVYAHDPLWAPQSEAFAASLLDNPGRAFVQPLLCMDDGAPLARAVAILRPGAFDDRGRPLGYIGFFECLGSPTGAGQSVLDHAEDLLRRLGAATVQAPRADNNLMGLVVEGGHLPQTVLTPHNPHYYVDILQSRGYRVRERLFTYIFDRSKARDIPLRLPGIHTRTFDRQRLEQEAVLFNRLNRQIFSTHPGWLPRTLEEDTALIQSLLPMLDDELVIIAENMDGSPIGLLVCLPDVYQAGRAESIDNARLITIGAIPAMSQKGVGVAMCLHLMRNLLSKGYQTLEASWIRDSNIAPQNLAKRFAGRPGRVFALFEKDLAALPDQPDAS